MRRILEQARKELIQVIRDKRAMLMALGIPVMLLIPLSVSLSLTVDDLPIVVQDLDDSTASRLFIDAFRASITFRVIRWPVDEPPEAAFKANTARAALIIPIHFGRDMARGYGSPVQMLIDGELDVVLGEKSGHPDLRPLFADADATERSWFAQHKVLPINPPRKYAAPL